MLGRLKPLCLVLALCVLLGGCRQEEPAVNSSSLPEGSTQVTGRVEQVSGNDFVLALGSYGGGAMDSGDSGAAPEGASPEGAPQEGPAGSFGNGAPEGGMPEGAMPEGAEGFPEGGGPPDPGSSGGGPGVGEGQAASLGGGGTGTRFTESGETLSIRIPVGTPIYYGNLKVDFSQIQLDYVIRLTIREEGGTVLSGEILST